MELNSQMFGNPLSEDQRVAEQQRNQLDSGVAPMVGGSTLILEDSAMKVLKARTGIYKIVEMFGIRDDSGLTIRKCNDIKRLKQFGLLEESNWKYLKELIDICESKGVEVYGKELLNEIGFYGNKKKVEEPEEFVPFKAPEVDLSIVDQDNLESLDCPKLVKMYKEKYLKNIPVRYTNDKTWLIKKIREYNVI